MSRIIYNEGRVVGLSAYEIFVKHAIAAGIDPGDVPSEQAWLSSCVAMGSSLILYIPQGTGISDIKDFPLPTDSTLAAANTIIGSFFNGTGAHSGNVPQWVTSITSYGTNDVNNIPQPEDFTATQIDNYLKIVDGNINQIGTHSVRTSNTLKPDLTSDGSATISIKLKSKTTTGFYLLLTGFTDKSVLTGVVGTDGNQQATDNPQNGDFIGPEVFPWSTKIIFTIPTAATPAMLSHIKTGSPSLDVSEPDNNYDVTLTVNDSEVVKQGLTISAKDDGGIEVIHTEYSGGSKEKYEIGTLLDAGNGIDIGDGTGDKDNYKIIKAYLSSDAHSGITIDDGRPTKISASLDEGDGIDIGDGNGTAKKISASLTSGHGSGITITPNGAGKPIQISTNLDSKTGSGIDFEIDNNDQNSTTKYIKAVLAEGSGISITPDQNSTTKTIAANLSAGDGIRIEPDGGAKKISAVIHGGSGINITTSNGAYIISTTESGIGYTTIKQGDHFTASPYNQFCSYKLNLDTQASSWELGNDGLGKVYLDVQVLESSDIKGYYEVLNGTPKPAGWETEYKDYYYTRSGSGTSQDPYVYTNLQGQSAPTWNATLLNNGLYIARPSSVGIKISGTYTDTSDPNNRLRYTFAKLPYHESAGSGKPKQLGFYCPYYEYENYGFAFRHADDATTYMAQKSRLFSMDFIGRFMYLNDTHYKFSHNSGNGGLWNIRRWKGTYTYGQVSSGTEWQAGLYYTQSGSGTSQDPYVYTLTTSKPGDWETSTTNYYMITTWQDVTKYIPDLTNDYTTFGGSWTATCSLNNKTDGHSLVAYAVSYSDGYNTQFREWSNLTGYARGRDICTSQLNLSFSGTFYL